MFQLHPQLSQDCAYLGRFTLCHVLWMRDANYPWAILVPDRVAVREIHELSAEDQAQLIRESSCLSRVLAARFEAHKMNLGALGNLVPQLHIHHVVRYRSDPAWPAPVWGRVLPRAYDSQALAETLAGLQQALQGEMGFQPGDIGALEHQEER
ncbi:MAG: HIT family protein [Candidatus Thiodiazotropha sp.]